MNTTTIKRVGSAVVDNDNASYLKRVAQLNAEQRLLRIEQRINSLDNKVDTLLELVHQMKNLLNKT